MEDKDLLKVVFKKKVYRKHGFTIPIIKIAEEKFKTGQDLTYKKMIGKIELTDEEQKKYPFVINPHSFYKIKHGQKFNPNNPIDMALKDLAVISGKLAKSKYDYDLKPINYVGYFEDKLAEAAVFNNEQDLRFEAETLVRNSPISDYRKIALIINYRMNKTIKVDNMPSDFIKSELLKAVNENPKEVLMCFPSHNKDIARDIYILELISYNIIQKRPNGDLYDGDIFIGSNLSSAKNFMSIGSNAGILNKWKRELDIKKGLAIDNSIEKTVGSKDRVENYKTKVAAIKGYIVDENVQGAEYHYNELVEQFSDLFTGDVQNILSEKISKLKVEIAERTLKKKKEEFAEPFKKLDLEAVQRKIKDKKSNYKEEDCKDFWDNKDKLIEYMANVKFGK